MLDRILNRLELRTALAMTAWAALGCQPADDAPAPSASGLDGAGTGTTTLSDSGGDPAESTGFDTAGGDETGLSEDDLQSPDCDTLDLPGAPSDVAQTPRSDRDAEVLALTIVPDALVARQAHYEVVAADVAAMRAQVPELADVHPECIAPTGYHAWAGSHELPGAVWTGSYHAWDCHNAFYGVTNIRRTDGVAFAYDTPGVYGPGLAELYRELPGFPDADLRPIFPGVDIYNGECEPTSGSITLATTPDDDGQLTARTYTWEHPSLGTVVFDAEPGGEPTLVE